MLALLSSHDVAETSDLQGVSYGIEGEDRHVVVYKKDHIPCNEEIACLKRGEVYDPVKIELERKLKEEEEASYRKRKKDEEKPNSSYHEKYKHLIGEECGKSTAQRLETNEQFGCGRCAEIGPVTGRFQSLNSKI